MLTLEALRLARTVQGIRTHPLPRVIDNVARKCVLRQADVPRTLLAVSRAGSRSKRWFGWMNTCLTRSVVAGAMLAERRHVVLCVGFRPGAGQGPADGHAWLTVDGVTTDGSLITGHEGPYETVLEIPIEGGRREGL